MSAAASRRAWLLPLAVFLLALAPRWAYVHQSARDIGLDSDRLTQLDTHVFAEWARTIAAGDLLCLEQPHAYHLWTQDVAPESKWLEWYGGSRTFHQSPLYAYFVAAAYRLAGPGQVPLGYVQGVLGALACALTALLARRLVSPLAGWVAGLSLAFMGQYYFYDAFTLRDGPLALLTVVLAMALESAVRRGRGRDWLAAGAALGLFTLAKETGLPLLGLTLLALGWAWRRQPARLARAAALLLLGWGLLTAPAFVRNRLVEAPTFRLSTRGPEVLVVGNARGQDGIGWDVPAATMRRILMDANFGLARTAALVLATHRAEPWGFVELQARKLGALLDGYEVPNNADFHLHAAHLSTLRLGFVGWGELSALALLGLLLGLPRRRELAVPYLLFLALSASVVALYILGRFRVHLVPLLALFAALAVDWIVRAVRDRRHAALALAAAPLLLFWSGTRADGPDNLYYRGAAERGKNTSMMMLLLKSGDADRARVFYGRLRDSLGVDAERLAGLPYVPEDGTLEARLLAFDEAFGHFDAAGALAAGDPRRELELGLGFTAMARAGERYERTELSDLARAHVRAALAADPALPGAHRALATLHAQAGQVGQAFAELRAELEAHPDDARAQRDAGFIRLVHFGDDLGALRHFREALALGLDDDARLLACAARIEVNTTHAEATLRVRGASERVLDPALGLRHARRALELMPEDPVVMEASADALYANGFYDEAVDLLTRLADRLPWRRAELEHRWTGFLKVKERKLAEAAAAAGTPAPQGGSEPP